MSRMRRSNRLERIGGLGVSLAVHLALIAGTKGCVSIGLTNVIPPPLIVQRLVQTPVHERVDRDLQAREDRESVAQSEFESGSLDRSNAPRESLVVSDAPGEPRPMDSRREPMVVRDREDGAPTTAGDLEEPLTHALNPDREMTPDPVEDITSRFVQTEKHMATDDFDPDAVFESSNDVNAEENRRPEVPDSERGPQRIPEPSVSSLDVQSAPSPGQAADAVAGVQIDGKERRDRATDEPIAAEAMVAGESIVAGEPMVATDAQGHPNATKPLDDPSGEDAPAATNFGARGSVGALESAVVDSPPELDDPDWWQPMASFVTVVAAPEAALESGADALVEDEASERDPAVADYAPIEVFEPTVSVDPAADYIVAIDPSDPVTAEVVAVDPVPEDPLDGLAEVADETGEAPIEVRGAGVQLDGGGTEAIPSPDSDALQDGAERVVFDSPDEDAKEPQVSVRRTERAVYVDKVYDLLMTRWNPSRDLPMEQRVKGVNGNVTVRIVIDPSGRVLSKEVASSSGNPYLDYLATEAVPKRLPRFHVEMEQVSLVHPVTFKSR